MNPKKPKDLIKPTAEEVGQSQQLVDDIVGFYWAAVRKELSELESPSVTVANLGIFKIRYKQIDHAQLRYNNYLKKLDSGKKTFNKHAMVNVSKDKINKLDVIRKEMETEFERKKEVQLKRKNYVTTKALEEQRKNS